MGEKELADAGSGSEMFGVTFLAQSLVAIPSFCSMIPKLFQNRSKVIRGEKYFVRDLGNSSLLFPGDRISCCMGIPMRLPFLDPMVSHGFVSIVEDEASVGIQGSRERKVYIYIYIIFAYIYMHIYVYLFLHEEINIYIYIYIDSIHE